MENYKSHTIFHDKIFSLTIPWLFVKSLTFPWHLYNSVTFPGFPGFPDKWSPCPKSNQFISVPRCTSDKSLAKIRQQILEISWKHKTTTWITDGRTDGRTHARTDGQRHGRTTRKHIASAGAYRWRRLNEKTTCFAGGNQNVTEQVITLQNAIICQN